MSTAALMPQPPPQTPMLSLAANNSSSLSKISSESPRSGSSKVSVSVPSLVHQATAQRRESPSEAARKSPALPAPPKLIEDHQPVSPSPEKFPEPALPAAPSPKEPVVSPPPVQQASMTRNPIASPRNKNNDDNNDHLSDTASNKAPAQIALLLSQALAEADALRRDLASEKKRLARAERLLAALQAPPSSPNSATTVAEARNVDGRLPESAAKAILDAETRAEHAERDRDEALHALASLSASFAELERYEAACAMRSSDARGAYLRLLANLTSTHPLPQSSPAVSTSSPRDELRLNLPRVPAPLLSLPSAIHLPGPTINAAPPHGSTQPSRYSRPLQAQPTYAHAQSPIDTRQANAFESLPLPPPPAATGLASINTSLPVKRHRSRLDEAEYEEQKRRRLVHEMDIDVAGPDAHAMYVPHASSRHYQSGPPSAQPLSAHPTAPLHPLTAGPSPPSRLFDRPPSVQYGYPASGPNHQREGIPSYAPSPGSRYATYDEREREYSTRDRESAGGMVRIDARQLVREAKARERRGRDRESYVRLPQSELQVQQRSQEEFHANERSRRRSVSGSSVRSKSSLSLDEMLLETATDGGVERGRPTLEQPATGSRQSQAHGAPQPGNGIVSPHSAAAVAASPTAQPIAKAPSTHAAPATNGVGRKASIPASQLMTLGPSGTILSGGGADAGASVDPAVRFPGLRTCRQCLQPGRYKEGKCVEKWGPGPQGPGTVCDRCRKKMKRVERRGTLDSSASLRGGQSQSQKASQATTLSLAPSQPQSQSQSQAGRTRAPPVRTDTLIVETEHRTSDSSQTRSPGHDSRYHHTRVPPASAAARHPSLASGQAHSQYGTTSHSHSHSGHQLQHAQSRRAPTPPYITAISSREQHNTRHTNSNARHAESDDDLDDEGKRRQVTRPTANGNGLGNGSGSGNGNGSGSGSAGVSGARYTHSESYTRQPLGDERDELAEDADGDADADADGSGVGSADAELEDADIMDAVDATMKVED